MEREKITKDFLIEYLESIPLPQVIVSMKCPTDVLVQRLKKRGMPFGMDKMSDEELSSAILKYQEWQNIIENFLLSKNIRVLSINNDNLLSDKDLLEQLKNIFE